MKSHHFFILEKSKLMDLATFVVEENYVHHSSSNSFDYYNYKKEIKSVYLEEQIYRDHSTIYVSKDEKENIVGAIRVLKWNYKDTLPIESIFSINPMSISGIHQYEEIWHIGRFAIKKGMDKTGFLLLKKLMVCAINKICFSTKSVAIAECDAKLLKILNLLGIESEILGKPIHYLGSETIPILLTHRGLKQFLDKNLHLLPENISQYNSIVFQANTQNYTIV